MSNADEKQARISIEQFKRKISNQRIITLPSGAECEVRTLTPIDYIREGVSDIPNDFLRFVAKLEAKIAPAPDTEESKRNYELFNKFLEITISKGVISPPFVLSVDSNNPEMAKNYIVFSELSLEDQHCLISHIIGTRK